MDATDGTTDGTAEELRRLLEAQQTIAGALADLPPSAELFRVARAERHGDRAVQAGRCVRRPVADTGPEMERRFDFALTYDRDLVVEAASALMRRVSPLGA